MLSSVVERVILTSFSDPVLDIPRTLVSEKDLFNLGLNHLDIFGVIVCISQKVPISTKNLWYSILADSNPIVFWTALMVRSTL